MSQNIKGQNFSFYLTGIYIYIFFVFIKKQNISVSFCHLNIFSHFSVEFVMIFLFLRKSIHLL